MADTATNTCRGCLRELKPMEQYSFMWPEIKELFVQCTSINIPPDEQGLPQQICLDCYNSCERWFTFRNMCVDVNNHLQRTVPIPPFLDQLNCIRIKEEVIDDDVEFVEESFATLQDVPYEFNFDEPVEPKPNLSPVVLLERLDPKTLSKYLSKSKVQAAAKKRIKCPVCKCRVADTGSLRDHLRKHISPQDTSCPICEHQFVFSVKVIEHILVKHLENHDLAADSVIPRCPICNIKCENMYKHIFKKHAEKDSLVCPICHISYYNRAGLQKHLLSHTGEKPFKCEECGKAYRQAEILRKHQVKFHGQSSGTRTRVKPPTEQVKQEVEVKKEHVSPRKLKVDCPICARTMCDRYALAYHMTNTHGKTPEVAPKALSSPPKNSIKTFSCPVCRKAYPKLSSLALHFVVHTTEKPHKCQICKADFRHRNKALTHAESFHPGETEIIKLKRGSAFKNGRPWEAQGYTVEPEYIKARAVKVKTEVTADTEDGYSCDQCSKVFVHAKSLKKHILKHHSGKSHDVSTSDSGVVVGEQERAAKKKIKKKTKKKTRA